MLLIILSQEIVFPARLSCPKSFLVAGFGPHAPLLFGCDLFDLSFVTGEWEERNLRRKVVQESLNVTYLTCRISLVFGETFLRRKVAQKS